MALGALRAFADAGRRIPEDVAVVGFDDVVDAAQYRPPLTTIRQDFDALGARAVATLLAMIEEGGAPSQETVDRKRGVQGTSVSVRVDTGGRRILKKKTENQN